MYNRFAEKRRRYLREYRDGIYTGMLLTGTLEPHLAEIGESAQAMFDRLVEQMKKAEGVTEQLKAENQMEWVHPSFFTYSVQSWQLTSLGVYLNVLIYMASSF